MNPLLLDRFNTPFESIPFDKITNEHFEPAILEAIKMAEQEVDSIVNDQEKPNFKNTIGALDNIGGQLDMVTSVFFNLNSAETNDELQGIAQKVSPILSDYQSNIMLNADLFKRVKSVYDQIGSIQLSSEESKLLDKTYKSFVRNGALLNDEDQKKLRAINKELSLLSLTFGENVLAESNEFSMLITNEEELDGLPGSAIEAAKHLAEEKQEKGWLFTLDYPSYLPFMTYSNRRALREKMYRAFISKANKGNDRDNKEVVLKIVRLRLEKSQLLGYKNYADYVLEERMAKSQQKVTELIDQLYKASQETAIKEAKELQEFAIKKEGPSKLQKWDVGFYSEQLKQDKIQFDAEKLKPYFSLNDVIEGVFNVANKLFGLQFKERTDVPVYHPEVKTYEITDEKGTFMALFYGDFFPRPGKRQGAWMTLFKSQFKDDKGVNHRPHVANVCNFTKPTKNKPSLLTFDEVTTLFHEFGHALHAILSDVKYKSLSGTNVLWDFVELPSQLLENWCYHKEGLDLFAKHYETGELIPDEMVEQIKKSMKFRSGSMSLRQLSFGILDMNWHSLSKFKVDDVQEFENKSMEPFELYPTVEGACMSTQFSHLFQGGYASGYYSYKWAEVLEADVFESFLEQGIFNKEVADKLRVNILSKGGTADPEELYISFKGRKASVKPLLKKSGLLSVDEMN